MTNLIAIIAVVVTNWTTVSRTTPVVPPEAAFYAVMRYNTLNQAGSVWTNYVALLVWKGKVNEFVLESVRADTQPALTREIWEPSQALYPLHFP